MSINVDPDLYAYSAPAWQCAQFPAGTTPTTLFACFEGIKIGQAWTSADPPPGNGIVELPQTLSCTWQLIDADHHCTFSTGGPASIYYYDPAVLMNPFFGCFGKIAGTFKFESAIVDGPSIKYFGGSCVLMSPLDDDIRSIQTVLAALNIRTKGPTYDTPRPLNDEITWHSITSAVNSTCIKIKFDHT